MRRIQIQQVAAATGYSMAWVSRVLNRHDPASPTFRHALASFLRLPESALFDDDGAP